MDARPSLMKKNKTSDKSIATTKSSQSNAERDVHGVSLWSPSSLTKRKRCARPEFRRPHGASSNPFASRHNCGNYCSATKPIMYIISLHSLRKSVGARAARAVLLSDTFITLDEIGGVIVPVTRAWDKVHLVVIQGSPLRVTRLGIYQKCHRQQKPRRNRSPRQIP